MPDRNLRRFIQPPPVLEPTPTGCRPIRDGRLPTVETRQLETTTGFVIYDLPGAETYAGPARLGAKLAPGNATMLVRHQTYVFAVLGEKKSGATVGFKVDPEGGGEAISAAATELDDELAAGTLVVSPGLRLDNDKLSAFLARDPRSSIRNNDRDGISFENELVGLGAATAAAALTGGLDGKRVAIEGLDANGIGIARAIEAQGGAVGRVATAKGCVTGDFDAATLADAFMSAGPAGVEQLGEVGKPWEIWKGDVDALFVGSKPGAMSGEGANTVGSTPVIATSPAAISSKALAILRQNGTAAVADFVAAVGPTLSWWPEDGAGHDDVRAATVSTVERLMNDTVGHADGAFMAACYAAEEFLRSWQDELPFGRPLG